MFVEFHVGQVWLCEIFNATYGSNSILLHFARDRWIKWWSFFISGINGTKICGPAKDACRKHAQDEAYKTNIHDTKCNCLSSCNELWYNAHASQADFELIKTYSKMDYKPKFDIKKYSVIVILLFVFSRTIAIFNFTFQCNIQQCTRFIQRWNIFGHQTCRPIRIIGVHFQFGRFGRPLFGCISFEYGWINLFLHSAHISGTSWGSTNHRYSCCICSIRTENSTSSTTVSWTEKEPNHCFYVLTVNGNA